MKEIHLRIRNVPDDDYQKLLYKAQQETGSRSVSSLVRKFIRDCLRTKVENNSSETANHRVEIRLKNKVALMALAQSQNMTINKFIVMLLNNYTSKQKIMSATQIQVLRESNYQLYQIGKNINQIAKALNQGKPINLTSQKLDDLAKLIDSHTSKVADVISTTPTL